MTVTLTNSIRTSFVVMQALEDIKRSIPVILSNETRLVCKFGLNNRRFSMTVHSKRKPKLWETRYDTS